MMGVLPPPVGGTEISGSIPGGGQITPLDGSSWSPKDGFSREPGPPKPLVPGLGMQSRGFAGASGPVGWVTWANAVDAIGTIAARVAIAAANVSCFLNTPSLSQPLAQLAHKCSRSFEPSQPINVRAQPRVPVRNHAYAPEIIGLERMWSRARESCVSCRAIVSAVAADDAVPFGGRGWTHRLGCASAGGRRAGQGSAPENPHSAARTRTARGLHGRNGAAPAPACDR